MRRFAYLALGLLMASVADAQTFIVDSSQSHVQAWVPHWENLGPSSPGWSYFDEEGNLIEIPAGPDAWQLKWQFDAFSLSGTLDITTERSPYNSYASHLMLDIVALETTVPSYSGFILAKLLTFYHASGYIEPQGGPCSSDGFYASPDFTTYCSGISYGSPSSLSGTFDGKTLIVEYHSGGLGQPLGEFRISESQPSLPEPSYPWDYSYKLVATSVPEAETYWLLAISLPLVIARYLRKKKLVLNS